MSSGSYVDQFEPVERADLGMSEGRLWLKFQLAVSDLPPPVLVYDDTLQLEVNLYQPLMSGDWFITKKGFLAPQDSLKERSRLPVFEINGYADAEGYFYMSIKSRQALALQPISIMPGQEFDQQEAQQKLFLAAYLGCIAIMILYNLSLFITLRDKSYFYYSLAVLFVHGFTLMTIAGLTTAYIWHSSEFMRVHQTSIFAGLGTLFTGLFGMNFLNSKVRFPKSHKLLIIVFYSSLAYVVLPWFANIYRLNLFASAHANLSSILLIILATRAAMQGDRPALTFLLAWVALIFSVSVFIMGLAGVIELTFWIKTAPLLGAAAEALLLSIALGLRYKQLEKEKTKLTAEVDAAVLVQQAFESFPPKDHRIEVATFAKSAELTGGDWHGFHYDQQSGLYLIVCGDTTGHGLSASLMSGVAAGAAHGFWNHYFGSPEREETIDPEKLLIQTIAVVNGAIYRVGPKLNKAMTFVAIAIDANTGQTWQVNAAHNHPIVYSSDKLKSFGLPGSILGRRPNNLSLTVKKHQLNEGDLILVYTDGLIENTGPTGDSLDLKRTLRSLQKSEFLGDPAPHRESAHSPRKEYLAGNSFRRRLHIDCGSLVRS